jgi:mannose-6-phosphate isomerase-like protein (cupin superfamily)
MSLLVLKGVVESDKYKVDKGTFISDIYEIGNVSSDFTGLLLSNDRIDELGDAQINPGFEVKRIFFVDNMPVGAIRGQHAHKTETEFLYVVDGEFYVNIKSESNEFSEILIKGQSVISLPMAWTSVENLTNKGLLLALLSHKYDKRGFII